SSIEFVWAGDTARHVGTLVHRHLERIAYQGIDDWLPDRVATLSDPVRRGLQHLGVENDQLDLATDKALRALRQTLADETGRWILRAHRDARCEWPLTLHDDVARHYVIDRSFIDDQGVRWIIDYKTGEHLAGDRKAFLDQEQARYSEQLETYGRILRLLEDRPIRLALYFPLFPDWRVWDYPA
ncbi:MAG: PD-(D/E)XK nuclease family protein, partial [Sedimenticolaceae bacterium]